MNNSYFGHFLNNHTWRTLQGPNPLGRKYWESPQYHTKSKNAIVNNIYTKDGWVLGVPYNVPANTSFEPVGGTFKTFRTQSQDPFPNTQQKWRNWMQNYGVFTQQQLDGITVFKQGLNSGWFADYNGNFLDLKERGSVTRPCSFDFSQTFKPNQLDTRDRNLFYGIQLGQNMRSQIVAEYPLNGGGRYNLLPGQYAYAVTR